MRNTFFGVFASVFLGVSGANAAPIVMDFDTDSGGAAILSGTVLGGQYTGVTFSGVENGSAVATPIATNTFFADMGGAPVSGNILQNRFSGNNRADFVTISFASAVRGIMFDFVPFGSQGPATTIEVFGGSGLLYSGLLGGPASSAVNFSYTDIFDWSGVRSVVFGQAIDDWVWGLDNFQYSVAEVPLPGAFPFLVFALGAIGLVGRRRKAA